jgi:hypothetical protein
MGGKKIKFLALSPQKARRQGRGNRFPGTEAGPWRIDQPARTKNIFVASGVSPMLGLESFL